MFKYEPDFCVVFVCVGFYATATVFQSYNGSKPNHTIPGQA